MQTQSQAAFAPTTNRRTYWARTILAGLVLVGLAVLYFAIILPIANAAPPGNFRFPFSFITVIYAVDLAILGFEFFYKLGKPPNISPSGGKVGASGIFGMSLRTVFMLVVGGSYVTGAALATPTIFQPVLTDLPFLGTTVTYTANFLHDWFALLLIVFGLGIVVFEITKVVAHKQTWKDWLGFSGRYPEIKGFYWAVAICVIVQGTLGLFLLGTLIPNPYAFSSGILGSQSYGFEHLIRQIHGPLGALTFALFTNHIYLRVRPEWHIR